MMTQAPTHPPLLCQEVCEESIGELPIYSLNNDLDDEEKEGEESDGWRLSCRECAEAESEFMSLASNESFASLAAEFKASIGSCKMHTSMENLMRGTSFRSVSSTENLQRRTSYRSSPSMTRMNSFRSNTKNNNGKADTFHSPQTVIVQMSERGDLYADDGSVYNEEVSRCLFRSNCADPDSKYRSKNPVLKKIFSLVDSVEEMRENRRNEVYHQRIGLLRNIVQQARIDAAEGSTDRANLERAMSLDHLGELGVALFSPLDGAFETDFENITSFLDCVDTTSTENGSCGDNEDELSYVSEDEITIQIRSEDAEILKSSPYILSKDMMQQIADCGLPSTISMKQWVRLYSVSRDGDSFGTFLRNVKGHSFTVLVVQTCRGEIVGGFVDHPWEQQKNVQDGSRYYGTGGSFLFHVKEGSRDVRGRHRTLSFCPLPIFHQSDDDIAEAFANAPADTDVAECYGDHLDKDKVIIHKWQGKNNYNQLCHTREGKIAMGGGGEDGTFGLCLQDFFGHGSTGACDTYGTTGPLTRHEHFDVVEFEVYGFEYAW
uniref:Oxidation resistance protein 1 n=1 Tax=Ditylum brightwellii TaxID=49249 RepID=A0A7S1Z030_9STRA|mmetsp:Transcript_21494/g.31978  ORF Transcript_21494/g.31978 Transcript_21494/m.31978 type:complete len:547 (+) Transcript_21494:68-1708(+)